MTNLSERPFFVVGKPRSGTTLLRFILSSHPRLHIPPETGFLPFLGFDTDTPVTAGQAHNLLVRIGRLNRGWAGLVTDADAFYRSLPQPTLAHFLDELYRRKIAQWGAERWGDKTPSYVLHLPLLGRIFATAQFVHMIRDGRDVTLSAQKRWGHWYMDPYYLLANWVRHVEQGRKVGRTLPTDRYLEVRYEDLVQQPEVVARTVCRFLGESFYPQMLDHTRLARELVGPRGHVEVWQPISTDSVQRWRTQMSSFEQKVADRVAGPTLVACGYELSAKGAFSPSERLGYLSLSAKYVLVQGARHVLTRLGLLTLNRDKRSKWWLRPNPKAKT